MKIVSFDDTAMSAQLSSKVFYEAGPWAAQIHLKFVFFTHI